MAWQAAGMAVMMMRRPGAILRTINADPGPYVRPAMAIVAASIIVSFYIGLLPIMRIGTEMGTGDLDPAMGAHILGSSILAGILPFVATLYVVRILAVVRGRRAGTGPPFATALYAGRPLDGVPGFRTLLVVLSYATVPYVVVAAMVSLALAVSALVDPSSVSFLDEYADIMEPEDIPVDVFAAYMAVVAAYVTAAIWSFILSIKALRVACGFGIRISLGVLIIVLLIGIAADMLYGMMAAI